MRLNARAAPAKWWHHWGHRSWRVSFLVSFPSEFPSLFTRPRIPQARSIRLLLTIFHRHGYLSRHPRPVFFLSQAGSKEEKELCSFNLLTWNSNPWWKSNARNQNRHCDTSKYCSYQWFSCPHFKSITPTLKVKLKLSFWILSKTSTSKLSFLELRS